MNPTCLLKRLTLTAGLAALSACSHPGATDDTAPAGFAPTATEATFTGRDGATTAPVAAQAGDGDRQAPALTPVTTLPPMPPALDTRHMRTAEIRDTNGMVAAQVRIPADWQTAGGVTLDTSTPCASNMVKTSWATIGPDSLTVVELMPGFNWQVQGTQNPMSPCPVAPFRSVREFITATVRETRPGARILDFQKQPQLEQQAAQAANGRGAGQAQYDGGRMLIGYAKDGVEMREVLIAVLSLTNAGGSTMGSVGSMYSIRAPEGRLDMELPMRIAQSMQPNPAWMQMLQQQMATAVRSYHDDQSRRISDWHNRRMAMINAKGMADRQAIRMRANQDVANTYSAIAANTSATNDRMHATTMSGVRQVNNYAGVNGGVVENSIHNGSRVFQSTSNPDDAFSTDQPYAQPVGDYTELEQIP